MPFLATYTMMISIQFTIYESIMDLMKKRDENYSKNQVKYTVGASFVAGAVASSVTNGLEVLTVAKQTRPENKLSSIIKKEGMRLFTKGLGARVIYNSVQSIVFFSTLNYVGDKFGVDVTDMD